MDVFLLGTGTAIPLPQHAASGLVVKGSGQVLLFDIGPGTLTRLHLASVDCDQLDHLLISHLHPDHTLDLATLLLVFNYAPNAERTKPFALTGCQGLRKFFDRMVSLYPEIAPSGFQLEFREARTDAFQIGGLRIRTAPSGHTAESISFRIEDGQRAIVYSGDASPQGDLVKLAEGADLLVSECSFPAGWSTEDHLNADTLGEIADRAGVKSVVTVHSYPPALAVDLTAQIRTRYRGPVQQGIDGLHLTV